MTKQTKKKRLKLRFYNNQLIQLKLKLFNHETLKKILK